MTPRQRPPAAPRSLLLPLLLLCTLQRAQGIPIGGSEQQEQQQQKWVGGAGEAIRSSGLGLVPSALLQWPTREEFGGPPDVTSEAELKALGPFIAPILYGGLGNVLFQLAALIKHSQDTDLPLVIGYAAPRRTVWLGGRGRKACQPSGARVFGFLPEPVWMHGCEHGALLGLA